MKYKENLEILETDLDLSRRPKKSGFVKADQLFYFNKKKSNYYVVGRVDEDVLLKLLERVGYLDGMTNYL